jgi:hypothetical protein
VIEKMQLVDPDPLLNAGKRRFERVSAMRQKDGDQAVLGLPRKKWKTSMIRPMTNKTWMRPELT